jgi:O-antigen ligase
MGLLIALFSVSALVWTIPLLRGGRVVPLAMVVVVIGTVFGPFFYTLNGPIQLSLDRIALAALVGFVAVRWRMGQLDLSQPIRTDWLVVALTVWFLFRVVEGNVGEGVSLWLAYVAMPTAIYAVCRSVRVTDRDLRWVMNAFLALGCYLAATGLMEISNFHSLVFPRYIVDPEHWVFLGRARGPLLSPVSNGVLMTIACSVAVLRFIHADRYRKVVYAAATLLLAGGIYATLTRSVWVGAILAVGLIGLVYLPRWVRILGLAASVLAGAAIVSGFSDQLLRLERDKHVKASDSEKSMHLRPVLAVVAYEMFKDRPLAGHGYRRYMDASVSYHSIRGYDMPLEEVRGYVQHNVLLAILVDTGLIGLSVFLLWLTMVSAMGWQLARSPEDGLESQRLGLVLLGLVASYLFNGMFHDVSFMPMIHMVTFFVAGLAVTRYANARVSVSPIPSHASLAFA